MLLAAFQLLKAGAQVHHVSKDGRSTALHEAVLRNHEDLTDLLLRATANPFLENAAGKPRASVHPRRPVASSAPYTVQNRTLTCQLHVVAQHKCAACANPSSICLPQDRLASSGLQLVCSDPHPLACCAGLTPVDVAINNKQVAIVRRLEQGSAFSGWLSQKVTKYVPKHDALHVVSACMHACHIWPLHRWETLLHFVTSTGCTALHLALTYLNR